MAPMQDVTDTGVCIHHERMARQIDEIHGHLLGTLDTKGMVTEHRELWEAHIDGKNKRRFVWEHVVGYLLTGALSAIVAIFIAGL